MTENGQNPSKPRDFHDQELNGLEDLLDRVVETARGNGDLSIGDILDIVGPRWFAPLLLVPGLVMVAPGIGDIPGVPVVMGVIVVLVSVQYLLHRDHPWLPQWLQKRSADKGKVEKVVRWLRKPARFVDRWTRPRMTWLLRHAGAYLIAACCLLVAATTPVLEFIPFSAGLAGAAITAFGVALLFCDGLIGLVAILFSLGTLGAILFQFI